MCDLSIVPTSFNVTKSMTCISISCAIGGGSKGLLITYPCGQGLLFTYKNLNKKQNKFVTAWKWLILTCGQGWVPFRWYARADRLGGRFCRTSRRQRRSRASWVRVEGSRTSASLSFVRGGRDVLLRMGRGPFVWETWTVWFS